MINTSTIQLWVQLANVSSYLSANDVKTSDMFYAGANKSDRQLNFLLNFFSDVVNWAETPFSGAASLGEVAIYLYGLCGRYIPAASQIITNATGQVITNPFSSNPVTGSYQIAAVVGTGGGPTAGTTSWIPLNGTTPILKGASNVNYIIYNNVPIVSLGPSDQFSVDYTTGTITLLGGNTFQTGDTLVIPYTK